MALSAYCKLGILYSAICFIKRQFGVCTMSIHPVSKSQNCYHVNILSQFQRSCVWNCAPLQEAVMPQLSMFTSTKPHFQRDSSFYCRLQTKPHPIINVKLRTYVLRYNWLHNIYILNRTLRGFCLWRFVKNRHEMV